MFEVLFDFILECLGEILLQIFAEIGLEFGFESVKFKKPMNPVFSIFGLLILGGLIGVISLLIFPDFILVKNKMTGIRLIISPICTGLVLHYFGKWKQKQGKTPTYLATFWGGAIFAFAIAFTRWFIFHRSLN